MKDSRCPFCFALRSASSSGLDPGRVDELELAEVDQDPSRGVLLRAGERLGDPAGSVDVELAAKRDAVLSRVVPDLYLKARATVHHLLSSHRENVVAG